MSNSIRPDAMTDSFSPEGFATLFDRYEILGVIGQGGMGTVYKGYHRSLKRFVAIKVLRLDRINGPEMAARFLREMQAVGQMDHPNVVRATDAGQKDGLFYLVMEYLEGNDLSRLAVARGRLELTDACELARQAAVGLDYIHRTLVHRDIKPSNLLLTTAGVVKILDLGLARLHEADLARDERTPEGRVLGTFDYMAPEQAAGGGRIDGRADIYGLGCTLFKLLTGRAPFSGPDYDSVARKLHAHGHVPLTALDTFQSVPEGLRATLLRMTAKDPGERYPTAGQAAQALAPFAAGSQPARLSGDARRPPESAVQPLPHPLPEELLRLTAVPAETHPNASTPTGMRPRARRRLPRGLPVGLVALALALIATAWFSAPTLLTRRDAGRQGEGVKPIPPDPEQGADGNPPPATARRLDDLETRTFHPLLDRSPLVVGAEAGEPGVWQWDKGRQILDTKGRNGLLFDLGTTSRTRFTIEAGVSQIPWTGDVGVFWGYHEDAAARRAGVPNTKFAKFQMVSLWHGVAPKGGHQFAVRRGTGTLSYDAHGDIDFATRYSYRHELWLEGGEKIFVLDVERGRLNRALFAGVELTKLCTKEANDAFRSEPYQGSLGLVTLASHATFGNVRFIAHSAGK